MKKVLLLCTLAFGLMMQLYGGDTISLVVTRHNDTVNGTWTPLHGNEVEERYISVTAGGGVTLGADAHVISSLGVQVEIDPNDESSAFATCTLDVESDRHTVKMEGSYTYGSSRRDGPDGGQSIWHANAVDPRLDLDVDTNNDGNVETSNKEEDDVENPDEDEIKDNPGKIFSVNDGDLDEDGIVDYCDGIDAGGSIDDDNSQVDPKNFIELKLNLGDLPKDVKLKEITYTFTYAASDPLDATVKEIKEDGKVVGYKCDAPAGLRIWMNRNGTRDRKSVKDEGEFVPAGVELKAKDINMEGGSMTFYVEAVPGKEGSELNFDKTITVKAKVGDDEQEDTVRVNPIIMQFVTKGDSDSDIVPTKFIGVSTPRPEVKIKNLSKSNIRINKTANTATITVKCDKILDPVADNLPEGVGEIADVTVTVDGDEGRSQTTAVRAVSGGKASFWKQHPYKGKFNDVTVTIPLEAGTHTVKAETGENSAELTGFDSASFTLEKEVTTIPGTPDTYIHYNVAFPVNKALQKRLADLKTEKATLETEKTNLETEKTNKEQQLANAKKANTVARKALRTATRNLWRAFRQLLRRKITREEFNTVLNTYRTKLDEAVTARRNLSKAKRDVRSVNNKLKRNQLQLKSVERRIAQVERRLATPDTDKVAYFLGELDAIPENAAIYDETRRAFNGDCPR